MSMTDLLPAETEGDITPGGCPDCDAVQIVFTKRSKNCIVTAVIHSTTCINIIGGSQ